MDIVYYPTNKIRIPVNKQNVLASGIVKQEDADLILDYIDIDLPQSALPKNRILMLDLIANNDWKRPIYFSGGSFDKGEYIWMKEYLQLDGLVFKLVPIKTENERPFEMGRIDTELMADIVDKWEWGNASSPNIYHDTQTRSQGLSFRSNLARLMEAQIEENKIDAAKKTIDIAMTNVPFEYFGFYAFVEPFVDGYYKVGSKQKARDLFGKLRTVYQERLEYYAGAPLDEQYNKIDDILSDMEAYRRNIDILIRNRDREFAEKQTLIFNEYIDKFTQFIGEEDQEYLSEPQVDDPDIRDTIPLDSIEAVDDSTIIPN